MMLPRVITLDRRVVRRQFEQRFSSVRMAKDYVAVDPFAAQAADHVGACHGRADRLGQGWEES